MSPETLVGRIDDAVSENVTVRTGDAQASEDSSEVGEFMKKKVFEPGRTKDWKGLTKFATGEELNPKAFAKDFEG